MQARHSAMDAFCASLRKYAQDIVDRHGRHHQPKAILEGGQYEEEGQYLATAAAKEEHFHKKFASTESAKEMRDFCAGVLGHIDSSKLGNDTAKSGFLTQVHKYAAMTKKSIIAGAEQAFSDMKKHARIYDSIKDMGKQEFTEWLADHKEYDSTQMQNLLTNKAYNKAYRIKNAKGEYESQDHAAWEEAKTLIARKATACMIDYMAHIEALNNTPDALIKSFLGGKGGGKHQGGAEAYEKEHGIHHGDGDDKGNITQSEINAVESELSKALNDAKNDTSKTAYMHAISHFLGKDGGMRDPNATKKSVMEKAVKRFIAKENALKEAKAKGDEEAYLAASNDFGATQDACILLGKAMGMSVGQIASIHAAVKKQKGDSTGTQGNTPQVENVTAKADSTAVGGGEKPKAIAAQPEENKGKPSLSEAGKKFMAAIGSFLNGDKAKKYAALADKVMTDGDKDKFAHTLEGNGIAKNKALVESLHNEAKESVGKGDKTNAKAALAKYYLAAKHLHQQLADLVA